MKKRKILGMLCALSISVMAGVPVCAANTGDMPLPNKLIGFSYSQAAITLERPKSDASSNYVQNTSGFDLWVESRTPSGKNLTVNGHAIVPTAKRRVRNNIYESGYRSCKLWINTTKSGTTGYLTGGWSPDCAGDYPAAN